MITSASATVVGIANSPSPGEGRRDDELASLPTWVGAGAGVLPAWVGAGMLSTWVGAGVFPTWAGAGVGREAMSAGYSQTEWQ